MIFINKMFRGVWKATLGNNLDSKVPLVEYDL